MTPERRAQVIIGAGAFVPALVVGLVGLLGGVIVAVVVFVVVLVGLAAWLSLAGERRALAGLSPRPADPDRDARLVNLVDGLCTTAGLRAPRLLVTDDPGCNLLVAGRGVDAAVLVVTRGLLDHLSRIELEGVLADGLVQIRQGDIVPATVAVATFGLGVRFALAGTAADEAADQAAAALTLYPPALARALDAMDEHGTKVAGARATTAHLWLADPRPASAGAQASRPPLAERAAALREL
jgi:Zn-dependent protease with chaperone function